MFPVCVFALFLTFYVKTIVSVQVIEGPEFVSEPPSRSDFSNNTGAKLECSARGTPQPTVVWTLLDGNAVTDVSNLRQVLSDGTITFLPFRAEHFRPDVHTVGYRCVASNAAGTIVSHDVHIKAVLAVEYDVHVYDEYAINGNTAMLKCHIPSFLRDYVSVVSWIRDDTMKIMATMDTDGKFWLSPHGDLYVKDVGTSDKGSSYKCQTFHRLTGETRTSSTTGRLIVTEPRDNIPPKIVDSGPLTVSVREKETAFLPCIAQGYPKPKTTWFQKKESQDVPLVSSRIKVTNQGLIIHGAHSSDNGLYVCQVSSSTWTTTREIKLQVIDLVEIKIDPLKQTLNVGQSLALHCEVPRRETAQITWFKDGHSITKSHVLISYHGSSSELKIDSLKSEDKGMYQCFTQSGDQVAQGAAQVSLGDFHPEILTAFEGSTQEPETPIVLSCSSIGNPEPIITWFLDGVSLNGDGHHLTIENRVDNDGNKHSVLKIERSRTDDGGLYSCETSNRLGKTRSSARVNIYGPLQVRNVPQVTTVSGENAILSCPVYGYPIDTIEWRKEMRKLPFSVRQEVFPNGTLFIKSVLRKQDSGDYVCMAKNSKGEEVQGNLQVAVMVPPKILPFAFQDELLREGMRARLQCVVSEGDSPVHIEWLKDGEHLDTESGIVVQAMDEFSSILAIKTVTPRHNGLYTCIARNTAGVASHSAQLSVNVPPKIVPFSFQDEQLVAGMFVRVSCVVSRGDLPLNMTWLKDGSPISSLLKISTRMIDDYSSLLSIDSLSLEHNGNYSCFVSNTAATATFTAPLIVNVPPFWSVRPNYEVAAVVEQNVVLHCQAEGFPKPTITWSKGQKESTISGNAVVFPNGTLLISSIKEEQEGYYVCKANNGIGVGLDEIVHIKVYDPPVIVYKSDNQTIAMGTSAALSCVTKGDLPLNITWAVDGKTLGSKLLNRYKIKEDQAPNGLSSELMITKVHREDTVLYTCTAQNAYGEDNAVMKLTVQSQPDPPLGMSVVDIGNQAVKVSWKEPFDGNSPLQKYTIEYKQKAGIVQNKTVHGSQQFATVTGFQPSATYFFRMFAENIFGQSDATEYISVVLAGEVPSGPPKNVDVQALDSQTVKVSWQPPARDTWNGDIRGYFVGYRESSSTDNYEFQMLEVPIGYDKGLSFTIPELKEFTKYAIVVQAFNDIGKGPLSEEILVMTSEDVPSKPPSDVSCSAQSADTILVKWKSPASDSVNGILRGHRVLFWPVDAWDGRHIGMDNSTTTATTMKNLAPFTNYSIQVVAFTLAGDGIPSRPVYCRTWEDVPGSLTDVKCVPGSTESVVVFWMPPQHINGHITHYTVYVEDPSNGWQAKHKVLGHSSNHEVQSLKRSLRYKFWVTASSVLGEGKPSQVVYCGPAASFVLPKCVTFNRTFKVKQGTKVSMPCPAVGVPTPQFTWLQGNQEVVVKERIQILPEDKSLVINNVQSEDAGNYSCQVKNDFGDDQVNHVVVVQVPPAAPILSVTMATFNSIGLRWKPRANGDSPIQGFVLRYKPEIGPWETIELQPYHDSHTLRNLRCGTSYEITISAANEVGSGDNSDVLTVSTDGGVPVAPPVAQLIEESTTHVTLHLDSWVTNGCPILYFTVEYKSRRANTWTLASKGIRPNQRMLVVADLTADAWYTLRMTAHSTAGTTVTEYDFSTVSLDEGLGGDFKINDLQEITGVIPYVDFPTFGPILICATVIIICLVGTLIWVRRRRNEQDAKAAKETTDVREGQANPPTRSTLRSLRRSAGGNGDGADSDDDISPYAMVRLSDFQPGTSKSAGHSSGSGSMRHSVPGWQHHNHPPPGMFVHHQPTAPPMSESYGAGGGYPHGMMMGGGGGVKGGPQCQAYAQPLKGNKKGSSGTHPPRAQGHHSGPSSETTFVFPPAPDGDYDPPPEFKWPFTRQ